MSLPTLQLRSISTEHYYASGDVTIQSGAAIAPGVLLQADSDGCIVIQAGACIGIGSILHARQGKVEVGEGANIGAEVLLIGQVEIGANACIGSASTILNSTIAPHQVIPPGSLVGDNSSPTALRATNTVVLPPVEASPESASAALESTQAAPISVNVYGQVYVNKMLGKMFPNSSRLNTPVQSISTSSAQDPWDD